MTKAPLKEARIKLWQPKASEYVTLTRYTDNVNADWWWRVDVVGPDRLAYDWPSGPDPVVDGILDKLMERPHDLPVGVPTRLGSYGSEYSRILDAAFHHRRKGVEVRGELGIAAALSHLAHVVLDYPNGGGTLVCKLPR